MKPSSIFDIIIASLAIILLIWTSIVYVKLQKINFNYLSTIADNWIKGPLLNINAQCDNNSLPLLEGYFQENSDGCYCPNNISKDENNDTSIIIIEQELNDVYFKSSTCPDGCKTINASPSLLYTGWNTYFLCGERMNTTYFDLTITDSASKCDKLNKKNCGYIDSLNNFLCVDKKDDCPINYIKFVYEENLNTTLDQLKLLNVSASYLNLTENNEETVELMVDEYIDQFIIGNYKYLNNSITLNQSDIDHYRKYIYYEDRENSRFSNSQNYTNTDNTNNTHNYKNKNNKYLVYSNNYTQGNIFVQFSVSETAPCIIPIETQTPELNYPLNTLPSSKCTTYINNKNTNSHYIIVDSQKYSKLLLNNLMYNYAVENLYYPETLLNQTINLYSRSYNGVKAMCIEVYNKINGAPELNSNVYILQQMLYFKSIFLDGLINPNSISIVLLILLVVIILSTIIKITLFNTNKAKVRLSTKTSNDLLNTVNCILFVMCFIFGCICVAKMVSSEKSYEFLVQYSVCLDENIDFQIQYFNYDYQFIKVVLIIETTFFLILSSMPMFFYIFNACSDFKSVENQK